MASRTGDPARPPTPASSSTSVKKNTPKSATGTPQQAAVRTEVRLRAVDRGVDVAEARVAGIGQQLVVHVARGRSRTESKRGKSHQQRATQSCSCSRRRQFTSFPRREAARRAPAYRAQTSSRHPRRRRDRYWWQRSGCLKVRAARDRPSPGTTRPARRPVHVNPVSVTAVPAIVNWYPLLMSGSTPRSGLRNALTRRRHRRRRESRGCAR